MRHVYHQQGSNLFGNLTHTGVVPLAAVGRAAADDELGLVLQGQLLHLVIIDATRFLVQVITDGTVDDAAGVDE